MHKKLVAILGFSCLLAGFLWGAATMKLHVFPYKLLRQTAVPGGPIATQIAVAHTFKKYPREGDIVFVGDSIFAMVEWPDVFPDKRVVRRAIWGDTTGQILNRFDSVLATRAPVAVMLAGTNDLTNGVPEAEIVANIRAIRKAYPGDLYVLSVIPCSSRYPECPEKTKRINSLNAKIKAMGDIRFVDVASTMNGADIADGTHPNLSGLDKIIDGVKAALAKPAA